jgi:hypothetical protein
MKSLPVGTSKYHEHVYFLYVASSVSPRRRAAAATSPARAVGVLSKQMAAGKE